MEDELFEIKQWMGHEQHQCKLCSWNTLRGLADMQEHIRDRHLMVRKPAILVADKNGQDVTEKIEIVELREPAPSKKKGLKNG